MFQKLYSSAEIRNALRCYDDCKSFRKASKKCGVSKSTIQRWHSKFHALVIRTPRITKRLCMKLPIKVT